MARSDSCPKKKEAVVKGRNWKGIESMVQKPAPTPTTENQKIPEPISNDLIARDDGLYARKNATQDRGILDVEREAMERGLDSFRASSSLVLPVSSPLAPAPRFQYAFDQIADLKSTPSPRMTDVSAA